MMGRASKWRGPQEARLLTLRAVEKLREEQEDAPFWSGWTLIAVDEVGDQLFTLDLGRSSRGRRDQGTFGWH